MSGEERSVRRILANGKRTRAAILHVEGEPVQSSHITRPARPDVSAADLRAALDRIVRESLRPIAAGLGGWSC